MLGLTDTCCQNAASIQDCPGQGNRFWNIECAWEWASFHMWPWLYGCMVFECTGILRMNLDSCLLFSLSISLLFPALCLCLGPHVATFTCLPFSFPIFCMKKKHSIHSFILQIRCGVQSSFLLHFRHLSECRKSSWRAGALYYLGFVEEVSLIVAFVKLYLLGNPLTHKSSSWRLLWRASFYCQFRSSAVVKCASLWEILVFPFPLLISVCPIF